MGFPDFLDISLSLNRSIRLIIQGHILGHNCPYLRVHVSLQKNVSSCKSNEFRMTMLKFCTCIITKTSEKERRKKLIVFSPMQHVTSTLGKWMFYVLKTINVEIIQINITSFYLHLP